MTPPAATLPKLAEAAVLRSVLAILKHHGIRAWRNNTGAATNPAGRLVRFGLPGGPDVLGVLPGGRALAVETKREGWRPSGKAERERWAKQRRYLNVMNSCGGAGLAVDNPAVLLKVLPLILAGATVFVREDGQMEITPCRAGIATKGGE